MTTIVVDEFFKFSYEFDDSESKLVHLYEGGEHVMVNVDTLRKAVDIINERSEGNPRR